MRLIYELRDLNYASPATVSRAGILYISDGDQWKWYVQSWIQRREETEQQKEILQILFEKYVEKTLLYYKLNLVSLTPVLEFNMVQSLCHLLEGLLTPENIPPGTADKMLFELFFCFAAVWAFGGALAVKDGEDYRSNFNRWWRSEWRPIRFPDGGTVFDYYVDGKESRFKPLSEITETVEYDPETPMTSITVPTQETVGFTFWLNTLMDLRAPAMFIGYSGCGKTAVIQGALRKLDPEEKIYSVVNFNYYTDSQMLQKVLEGDLVKKAGKNFGPPGQKRLVYFIDDMNMPKLDQYNTQTPIALLRQHFDHGHWYDRNKLTLKNIENVQYVSAMNPAAGSFFINPRLQRHFVPFAIGFPSQDSLNTIYSTFLVPCFESFDSSDRMDKASALAWDSTASSAWS